MRYAVLIADVFAIIAIVLLMLERYEGKDE